jgi:hypothetical protein
MRPVAVITRREVVDRILAHLRLPLTPEPLCDGWSVGFDHDAMSADVERWEVLREVEARRSGLCAARGRENALPRSGFRALARARANRSPSCGSGTARAPSPTAVRSRAVERADVLARP